jgi:hypothetical protein
MQRHNIHNLCRFSDVLKVATDEHHLMPNKIYNADETGIAVNPKCQPKILALKWRRQVGILSSAQKRVTVTAETHFSTSGAFHVSVIFPRKIMRQELHLNLPPGEWAQVYETIWIINDLFCVWFEKFLEFSGARKESPVHLLQDGLFCVWFVKFLEFSGARKESPVLLLQDGHRYTTIQRLGAMGTATFPLTLHAQACHWTSPSL